MKNQVAEITEPVVAININQSYRAGINRNDLYEFTRGVWRIGVDRARTADYAFAVYQGVVKEVYEIDQWYPAGSTLYANRKILEEWKKGRYEFLGKVAADEVRDKYVGKTLPERHAQNPIKYFNC